MVLSAAPPNALEWAALPAAAPVVAEGVVAPAVVPEEGAAEGSAAARTMEWRPEAPGGLAAAGAAAPAFVFGSRRMRACSGVCLINGPEARLPVLCRR